MWNYEKRLQYPVCITKSNPAIAKVIISQFGGPDAGLLTDIGTEEFAQRRWK